MRTPGLWIVDLQAQGDPLIRGGEEEIDGVPQTVVAEVYSTDEDNGESTMANATMLAAAPMLYDTLFALREVLVSTGWMEHHVMTRDSVNDALARAEWVAPDDSIAGKEYDTLVEDDIDEEPDVDDADHDAGRRQ